VKQTSTAQSRHFDVQTLRDQLTAQIFGVGDRLIFVPIVDSTNILAMHLAQQGSDEGTVVLTDSQTAGKGRLGRPWLDVQGYNALSSTILRPLFSPYLLVMIASLAVVDAIAQTCGVTARIKWPNDVLIDDQKVAGILIETSRDLNGRMVAIIGIGVNVNGHIEHITQNVPHIPVVGHIGHTVRSQQARSGLAATATTLEVQCGHEVSRETFIAHLLQYLETHYLALQQEAQDSAIATYQSATRLIREQWRSQLSTLGRTIEVRQGDTILSGVAEDVDNNGELLLRCYSGERVTITWGDIGYPTA
jgi:BirA family biotin operon repressor/biotin-[acetyl-CoA-carboxylase] ligase